jgi:hypothetical protein
MKCAVMVFIFLATAVADAAASRPPQGFASRAEATAAGCLFGHLKGPDTDICVLGQYTDNSLKLDVYATTPDGAMQVQNELAIPSQYYETSLSLADMLGQGTDWMVVETTGMHGTGIGQRVLFVLAWDGTRFRAVAAETLDYHCAKPTSQYDYALRVQHEFKPLARAPGLVLDYQLTRDGALIGKWTQQLRWRDHERRFVPYQSTVEVQTDPVVHHLLAQLERVRVYSASGPMDPARNANDWMGRSELMDVMGPACSPSLLYVARDFTGKWSLDGQRSRPAEAGMLEVQSALAITTDRDGLHVKRDAYRPDGKAFPLTVRLTGGKQVQGTATARREGEKMIVTIQVEGWQEPLQRILYRDGHSLVVEESGGPVAGKAVAYYEKY